MAVITFEEVIPSPIQNTTVVKGLVDGVHKNYRVSPNDGYVLHDNTLDWYDGGLTEDGEPIGNLVLGYASGMTSCRWDYDFAVNPREFYAVPEDSVPADQIFGGGDNDHEIA